MLSLARGDNAAITALCAGLATMRMAGHPTDANSSGGMAHARLQLHGKQALRTTPPGIGPVRRSPQGMLRRTHSFHVAQAACTG